MPNLAIGGEPRQYVCDITVVEYRDTYGLDIPSLEYYLGQSILANVGRFHTVIIEDPYHIDTYRIAFRLSVDWSLDSLVCVGSYALEALMRHVVVGKLGTPVSALTVELDEDDEWVS